MADDDVPDYGHGYDSPELQKWRENPWAPSEGSSFGPFDSIDNTPDYMGFQRNPTTHYVEHLRQYMNRPETLDEQGHDDMNLHDWEDRYITKERGFAGKLDRPEPEWSPWTKGSMESWDHMPSHDPFDPNHHMYHWPEGKFTLPNKSWPSLPPHTWGGAANTYSELRNAEDAVNHLRSPHAEGGLASPLMHTQHGEDQRRDLRDFAGRFWHGAHWGPVDAIENGTIGTLDYLFPNFDGHAFADRLYNGLNMGEINPSGEATNSYDIQHANPHTHSQDNPTDVGGDKQAFAGAGEVPEADTPVSDIMSREYGEGYRPPSEGDTAMEGYDTSDMVANMENPLRRLSHLFGQPDDVGPDAIDAKFHPSLMGPLLSRAGYYADYPNWKEPANPDVDPASILQGAPGMGLGMLGAGEVGEGLGMARRMGRAPMPHLTEEDIGMPFLRDRPEYKQELQRMQDEYLPAGYVQNWIRQQRKEELGRLIGMNKGWTPIQLSRATDIPIATTWKYINDIWPHAQVGAGGSPSPFWTEDRINQLRDLSSRRGDQWIGRKWDIDPKTVMEARRRYGFPGIAPNFSTNRVTPEELNQIRDLRSQTPTKFGKYGNARIAQELNRSNPTIPWDAEAIRQVRKKFNIPAYTSLPGTTLDQRNAYERAVADEANDQ